MLPFLKSPAEKYAALNPVIIVHESADAAHKAAQAEAGQLKGKCYVTSGTTSMEPLITGAVYMVGVPKKYEEMKEGEISNYRPKWANGGLVVHRLVQKDKGGWIASGDNNRNSENYERVRPDNYIDTIVKIHSYKGAEKTRVTKKN